MIRKYEKEFQAIGYEIEPFGGNEYAIRGVPANLYSIPSKELLLNLIDSLSSEVSGLKSDLILEKIASASCKAAVKGHNKLSYAEAEALIDQLLELENPYHCPHGRPTIITMSKYEIEKKFKRII
jgi:DNA mismatch repair protein MutL